MKKIDADLKDCPYATSNVDVGGVKTYCEHMQVWTNCEDFGECTVSIPDRCPNCGSRVTVELKWYDMSVYDMESHWMWEIDCAAHCPSHPLGLGKTPQAAIDNYRQCAKTCKPKPRAGEQLKLF